MAYNYTSFLYIKRKYSVLLLEEIKYNQINHIRLKVWNNNLQTQIVKSIFEANNLSLNQTDLSKFDFNQKMSLSLFYKV